MKLLMDDLHEDLGTVTIPKSWQIVNLAQELPTTDLTAFDYVRSGDVAWTKLQLSITKAEADNDGLTLAILQEGGEFNLPVITYVQLRGGEDTGEEAPATHKPDEISDSADAPTEGGRIGDDNAELMGGRDRKITRMPRADMPTSWSECQVLRI